MTWEIIGKLYYYLRDSDITSAFDTVCVFKNRVYYQQRFHYENFMMVNKLYIDGDITMDACIESMLYIVDKFAEELQ